MKKIGNQGVPLECPNSECRHTWKYNGKSKFYTSCPYCRTNVHVINNKVDAYMSRSLNLHSQDENVK